MTVQGRTYRFQVSHTNDGRNGTLIYIWSSAERAGDQSGWNLADYRCDGMGDLLTNAVRRDSQ